MDNEEVDLSSKTSSDSITTTGINSVWEPSSDEANPSSVTIMKIEATSAPMIQITPTSSTSQKKKMSSATSTLQEAAETLNGFHSSSSSGFVSSVTIKTPKKTSEKKIDSLLSKENDKSNGITNQVETENKNDDKEKDIDKMIQKQSELLHEFETKKVKKVVSSSSSKSLSSTTANDSMENGETDSQGISNDDNLQIPSLASSSSISEPVDVSSLDPTPLDVPTSWSLSSTQTETSMDSKLENVSSRLFEKETKLVLFILLR